MNRSRIGGIAIVVAVACMSSAWANFDAEKLNAAIEAAKQQTKAGKVDKSLRQLEKLYESRRYEEARSEILREILSTMLHTNRLADARARFLAVANQDKDIAAGAVGVIERYYFNKAQYKPVVEWAEEMARLGLPERSLAVSAQWSLQAAMKDQDAAVVQTDLVRWVDRLSPETGRMLARGLMLEYLKAGKYTEAAQLNDVLKSRFGENPDWRMFVLRQDIELRMRQKEWEASAQLFEGAVTSMDDAQLQGMLQWIVQVYVQTEQWALADRLCGFVLKNAAARDAAVQETTTRWWVAVSRLKGDATETLRRIVAGCDNGIPPSACLSMINLSYALLMEKGTPQDLQDLQALCQRLDDRLAEAKEQAAIRAVALDTCFRTQDFTLALQILNKGMPGWDEPKLSMMKNKVSAHLALQEGRPDEAVTRFRAFMEDIKRASDAKQSDPVTGQEITREMILGLNAKRIGDIQSAAGKTDEARKSYDEAKAYYQAALKTMTEGSDTWKKVKADLEAVP